MAHQKNGPSEERPIRSIGSTQMRVARPNNIKLAQMKAARPSPTNLRGLKRKIAGETLGQFLAYK